MWWWILLLYVPYTNTLISPTLFSTLFNSTAGSTWTINTNWQNANASPCSYYGVTCDTTNTTVLKLILRNNNLQGTIPVNLFNNLTDLTLIDLGGNAISGSIPWMSNARAVTYIDFSVNSFSGSIPDMFQNFTALQTVNLGSNALTGAIPSSLQYAVNLTSINLSNNQLSSAVPDIFTNLLHLLTFDLSVNLLTSIPSSLGSAISLKTITLSSNLITAIPDIFSRLTSLQSFSIDSNKVSGTLPASLASATALQQLTVYTNALTGSIPDIWSAMTSLQTLILGYNLFTGSLPTSLSSCNSLAHLQLENNNLSGSLPSWLTTLTNLNWLTAQQNMLTGSIPTNLGALTKLVRLDISSNNLSGSLPSSIGNLAAAQVLNLQQNSLSGSLPATMTNLSSMILLYLQNNFFTGSVPSLGGMSKLQTLNLGSNAFSGSLTGIGSMPALKILIIRNNSFTTTLFDLATTSVLSTLDVSINNIVGNTSSLCTFTAIQSLNTSSNSISGSIPSCIGSRLSTTKLRIIDLSNNYITYTSTDTVCTASTMSCNIRTESSCLASGATCACQHSICGTTGDLKANTTSASFTSTSTISSTVVVTPTTTSISSSSSSTSSSTASSTSSISSSSAESSTTSTSVVAETSGTSTMVVLSSSTSTTSSSSATSTTTSAASTTDNTTTTSSTSISSSTATTTSSETSTSSTTASVSVTASTPSSLIPTTSSDTSTVTSSSSLSSSSSYVIAPATTTMTDPTVTSSSSSSLLGSIAALFTSSSMTETTSSPVIGGIAGTASSSSVGIIVGTILGALVLCVIVVLVCLKRRRAVRLVSPMVEKDIDDEDVRRTSSAPNTPLDPNDALSASLLPNSNKTRKSRFANLWHWKARVSKNGISDTRSSLNSPITEKGINNEIGEVITTAADNPTTSNGTHPFPQKSEISNPRKSLLTKLQDWRTASKAGNGTLPSILVSPAATLRESASLLQTRIQGPAQTEEHHMEGLMTENKTIFAEGVSPNLRAPLRLSPIHRGNKIHPIAEAQTGQYQQPSSDTSRMIRAPESIVQTAEEIIPSLPAMMDVASDRRADTVITGAATPQMSELVLEQKRDISVSPATPSHDKPPSHSQQSIHDKTKGTTSSVSKQQLNANIEQSKLTDTLSTNALQDDIGPSNSKTLINAINSSQITISNPQMQPPTTEKYKSDLTHDTLVKPDSMMLPRDTEAMHKSEFTAETANQIETSSQSSLAYINTSRRTAKDKEPYYDLSAKQAPFHVTSRRMPPSELDESLNSITRSNRSGALEAEDYDNVYTSRTVRARSVVSFKDMDQYEDSDQSSTTESISAKPHDSPSRPEAVLSAGPRKRPASASFVKRRTNIPDNNRSPPRRRNKDQYQNKDGQGDDESHNTAHDLERQGDTESTDLESYPHRTGLRSPSELARKSRSRSPSLSTDHPPSMLRSRTPSISADRPPNHLSLSRSPSFSRSRSPSFSFAREASSRTISPQPSQARLSPPGQVSKYDVPITMTRGEINAILHPVRVPSVSRIPNDGIDRRVIPGLPKPARIVGGVWALEKKK